MTEFIVSGVPGSPYVRKALLGLIEKSIPWRLHAMQFGEAKSDAHRARQPFGKIPVFRHGDFEFYETQAMLRYIDRIAPEPRLTPQDPRQEARMNQLIGITDFHVTKDVSARISWPRLVAPRFGMPTNEQDVHDAIPGAEICIAEIARLMDGGTFLAADHLSLADIMLAPHLDFFADTPEGAAIMARHPALLAWLAAMRARPSMQATTWEALATLAAAA